MKQIQADHYHADFYYQKAMDLRGQVLSDSVKSVGAMINAKFRRALAAKTTSQSRAAA